MRFVSTKADALVRAGHTFKTYGYEDWKSLKGRGGGEVDPGIGPADDAIVRGIGRDRVR